MRRALAVHRLFSQTGAGWVPLLEIIVRECPVAPVIEVNTAGMQALAERMLQSEDAHERRPGSDEVSPDKVSHEMSPLVVLPSGMSEAANSRLPDWVRTLRRHRPSVAPSLRNGRRSLDRR